MPMEIIWILAYILVGFCWAIVTRIASRNIIIDQNFEHDILVFHLATTDYYIINFPWYQIFIYPGVFCSSEAIRGNMRRVLRSKVPFHWSYFENTAPKARLMDLALGWHVLLGIIFGGYNIILNCIALLIFVPIRLIKDLR